MRAEPAHAWFYELEGGPVVPRPGLKGSGHLGGASTWERVKEKEQQHLPPASRVLGGMRGPGWHDMHLTPGLLFVCLFWQMSLNSRLPWPEEMWPSRRQVETGQSSFMESERSS